jgi:hypothetical protein
MKSSTMKLTGSVFTAAIIAIGCAGLIDNANTTQAVATTDMADLKANTEVVTTVFNGTREQEMIIVVRPDL